MARRTKQQPPARTATPATIAQRRARIVRIGEALPGAVVDGKQHLSFTVRGKRFAWYLDDHHGDGRVALHRKAGPGMSRAFVEANPYRYRVPAYFGSWLGLWLDLAEVDWDEVAELGPCKLAASNGLETQPHVLPGRRRSTGRDLGHGRRTKQKQCAVDGKGWGG